MKGTNNNQRQFSNEASELRLKIKELEKTALACRKAEEELRRREEKYRNIVELTLDLIFIVDEKGRYAYANPRFEEVTGYSVSDLIGRPFVCLVAPEFIKSTIDRFKKGMRGEKTPPYEAELIHRGGERIPVEFLVTTQYDSRGSAAGRLGIGRDITERRKVDKALRQLAADLAKAQLLAHIGNWRYDLDSKLSVWSEEMFRIFGLKQTLNPPSLIHCKKHIHTDDRPRYEASIRSALEGNPFEAELRIIRPDNSVCHIFIRGEAEFDRSGKIRGLFGTAQDVTERVTNEKKLKAQSEQLRILSAKISEAQEAERKRIARELHDQVGQNLTVVGINLNILKSAVSEDNLTARHSDLLDDSIMLVEQTSEFTRSLMADLRPPDMDDYGLIASIQWYSERFTRRSGVAVKVKGDEIHPRPDAHVENNLFRIVQEALTNVSKHADAKKVMIRINTSDNKLKIKITDDGIGFDQRKLDILPDRRGLGLMNMIERAESIGGRFFIKSRTGKGTEIEVEVPL